MASKPSTNVIFGKEYIKGQELLYRWKAGVASRGDEIVYNSEPEDVDNPLNHLHYGEIIDIFRHQKPHNSHIHLIHIQLTYGKILLPLDAITLQFKPKTKRLHNDTRCGPKHQNHDHHHVDSDDDDDAKEPLSSSTEVDLSKICRFFVYGPLRDDNDDSGSVLTKQWLLNCKAESGRMYGFRLYKERYEDYPFAVRTGDPRDYVIGRIIEWKHAKNGMREQVFSSKLQTADRIEGFIDGFNLCQRSVVDVINEDGQRIPAIAYYQNVSVDDGDLQFYDQIPERDWLKRDRSRDLSEYNPSAEMLATLQRIIESSNKNDELIDSLPLPPEELESDEMSDEEITSWEYFRISGDNIAIINDCRTIKKFRSGIHTAYGKYIVHSVSDDIYQWTLRIDRGGNGGELVIGIASKIMTCLNESFYQYDEFENYSLNVCNGYIVTQNMFEQYSMKSQSNDIVRMELNMRLCTLSYYINGQFQGIAYDEIEKNESVCYQLAVSLEGDQDGITLLDFKVVSL